MWGGVWSKPVPSISLSVRNMVPCSFIFFICKSNRNRKKLLHQKVSWGWGEGGNLLMQHVPGKFCAVWNSDIVQQSLNFESEIGLKRLSVISRATVWCTYKDLTDWPILPSGLTVVSDYVCQKHRFRYLLLKCKEAFYRY